MIAIKCSKYKKLTISKHSQINQNLTLNHPYKVDMPLKTTFYGLLKSNYILFMKLIIAIWRNYH